MRYYSFYMFDKNRLASNRGMTLPEIILAMGVLLMCALLFTAAFPVATQSRSATDLRSKAVSLATRQIEAARDAGYNSLLNYSGVRNRALVDSAPTSSPYSITNVDFGSGQSIANTLPQGTGTMTITTRSTELLEVSVSIRWRERGGWKTVSLSTLITYI